jgi:ABC-type lipoprotein export system ATPase subunit
MTTAGRSDLRALRRDKIGFVFQAPYLIPFLDVTDNVALLPMLAGVPNAEARRRALELLQALDVEHRARAMPSQLSGGEQQRVAIARGLVNRPPVILADEPTAPLDSERALAVIRILNDMARQFETAIIVVTHDEKIIPTFKRIYHIRDGPHSFHDPFLLGMALHYQSLEDERKRAEDDAAQAAERIRREAPDLAVSTATFEGPPKEILLAEAERFDADLVMVGSHGRGAAGRFLLGSVSHALALHAPCSVEIVRNRTAG